MKRFILRFGSILMILGMVGILGIVLNQGLTSNNVVEAASFKSLDAESSVSEVLDFAENANNRWSTIHVKGRSGVNGDMQPFETWVVKPNKYRTEEGEIVFLRNNQNRLELSSKTKKARASFVSSIPESRKAEIDIAMAVHRAEDPTLARDGDFVVDTPINDYINPGYFVRKELKFTAKTVNKVGMTSINGRDAVQLKVVFPKELAKEDSWDVFVDTETGVLLGLVVNPLPGNAKFETYIDLVEMNPSVDDGKFDVAVPNGYVAEN